VSRAKATILCIGERRNELIDRKALLEKNGYQVHEATSVPEGLQLFLTHSVDAVVLDCQMPGMVGDAVAAIMKRNNSLVPIILLYPHGPLPDRKLASVDTFLSKSQSPKLLLSAVERLLDGPPKPFFYRWLDNWKMRNLGARQ
jgi:CheY-like chemotaxis protein